MTAIKSEPPRGYLTHRQVAALADTVEREGQVVRFLAYTGLRWGELAALRVQDFDIADTRCLRAFGASSTGSVPRLDGRGSGYRGKH